MKLTNFLQTDPVLDLAPVTTTPRSAEAKRGQGFDQALFAAEKREVKTAPPPPSQEGHRHPPKPQAKEETDSEAAEATQTKPERKREKKEAPKPTDAVAPETPPTAEQDDAATDIVADIAEILQVPVETVMQWLADLNLTPADLTDTQAVISLLQTAFNAETPAALLTEPAFPDAFKAVTNAMAAFEPVEEEAMPVAAAPVNTPHKTPALEGLQLTVTENGEAVVTQSTAQAAAPKDTTAAIPEWTMDETAETVSVDASVTPTATNQQTGQEAGAQAGNQSALPRQENAPTLTEIEAAPLSVSNTPFENLTARVVEAARTPVSATVDAPDIMNQIMSRVRTNAGDSFAELRVTLRPENLGDVTLRVVTQNGIVAAQFVAESQRVKEVLESNFNQLQDVLREQGIQFSELSVSVRQDAESERMNQFAQGRQNTRGRAQRIADATETEPVAVDNGPTDMPQGSMNIIV